MLRTTRTSLVVCPFLPTFRRSSADLMIILSNANGVYTGPPVVPLGRQKLRSELMSMSMRQTLRRAYVMQTASFCSQAVSEAFKNLQRDNVTFIFYNIQIAIAIIIGISACCFIVFMAFQSQTNEIIAHTKEIIQMKDTMAGLRMDISARVVPRTDDTVNGTKAQDKEQG